MIIADENLHQQFVNDLFADGFTVQSVRAIQVGMDDRDIAKWVLHQNALLITEVREMVVLFRTLPKKEPHLPLPLNNQLPSTFSILK